MNKKSIVYGHIFIVANGGICGNGVGIPEFEDAEIKKNAGLGITLNRGDQMAQIWWVSSDVLTKENPSDYDQSWADHEFVPAELPEGWVKAHKSGHTHGIFPDFIPASLLADKKEGDTLTFRFADTDVDLEVTCLQLPYKYARYGKFEEALLLLGLTSQKATA